MTLTLTLPISGNWNLCPDEDHAPTSGTLSGNFTGLFVTKNILVPANWKGSHVFIRIVGSVHRYLVNNKMFFYSTDTPPLYMDITPWIKFGSPNMILLQSGQSSSNWKPGNTTVDTIQLSVSQRR